MSKNITIKVNHSDGLFIKNWEDAKFVGFSKKINSGLGACVIDLAEKFDYSVKDLNLNNDIEILISDKDENEDVKGPNICDSNSEDNQSSDTHLFNGGYTKAGQSFTGNGEKLNSSKFYLKKGGSPTGNAVAEIYAHTGTFGVDGKPTGSPLATSENFDVSTLTTSFQLISFPFADRITLINGTHYFVVIKYSGGDVSNHLKVGDTLNFHNGNEAAWYSSWTSFVDYDVCFYIYTGEGTEKGEEEPKLIYKGYISSYEPWAEGKKEGIKVNLLGYYTLLGQDIWKNGATTTFDYSAAATDIGTVFKALMTRYLAETTDPKLITGQIDTTGTTTQFKFEMLTYREGIDILRSLAPTNWFWYVDQYNQIKFRLKPTTATHSFVFKKHFKSIRIVKNMEKIKNAVLLYADNQNLLKLYTDASSILDYGRRVQKFMVDRGLTTDCDKIAQAFVAENKDPNIRIEVEILDNNEDDDFGYDIESIDPGDTCSFFGFEEGAADMIKENMLITEVRYFLDKAVIVIEPLDVGVIKRSENINERLDALEREGVNTTYVT
jgi:hypothetical protein